MKISSLRNQWVSISIGKRLSISALLFVLISVLVLYFSPNNITILKHEITKHVEATRQKSLQNNDRIYKSYSGEQRKIIEHHALRAVSNLEDAENKVLIALAVSHYTFNYVNATPAPKSKNGVDVMQTREANCGGSISMASDMLNFLGIKSIPVYGVGGVQFAHSMLEVVIPEQANILIDPFAGVAFTKNGLYLSFEKALEFSQDKTVVPLYALPQRDKEAQPIPLTDVDSSYSKVKNEKTRLPSSTQELGHYYLAGHKISGVAGCGQIDTVFIKVQPGDVFGEPGWKSRKVRPYQALAQSKDQNGNKVGWAHMLKVFWLSS